MKKDAQKKSKLKQQLMEKKRKGVKQVIWKLDEESRDYVESLGFETEPYLYIIYTKRFNNIVGLNYLLKTIHHKNKEGKKTIFSKLSKEEREILDKYGVVYKPYKYIINLCG